MYKLVIVEDEETIRHSLVRYIPWNQLGFEVVGDFKDGMEAIEYIGRCPCDVVLTDILMEKMTGLEMVRILYEIYPSIKAVFLSGYSNFDYAKQAIRYRVSDYLLKPVDEEELIRVFVNLKEEMNAERESKNAPDIEQEFRQILQRNFLRDLLSGQVDSQYELFAYMKFLGVKEVSVDCPLVVSQIKLTCDTEDERAENDRERIEHALREQQILSEEGYQCLVLAEKNDRWNVAVICRCQMEMDELQRMVHQKISDFIQHLEQYTKGELSFVLTHTAVRIGDLLREKDVPVQSEIYMHQEKEKETLCQKILLDYKLLVIELDLGNRDVLNHILDNLLNSFRGLSVGDVKFILKNLYSAIQMEYEMRNINVSEITGGRFDYSNLSALDNYTNITFCVKNGFCILSEKLKETKMTMDHGIIWSVMEYLDLHVGDELGHNAIAAKFRIHPGYLSRLFKRTTGETMSGYTFRNRMERAALFLQDGRYKVNDVAEMVGYSSASYFTTMFKRYTGYSPSEYRKRMLI